MIGGSFLSEEVDTESLVLTRQSWTEIRESLGVIVRASVADFVRT